MVIKIIFSSLVKTLLFISKHFPVSITTTAAFMRMKNQKTKPLMYLERGDQKTENLEFVFFMSF